MLTCPQCGHDNPEGAHYCNECAAALEAPEEDFVEDSAQGVLPPVPSFLRRDAPQADEGENSEGSEDQPYLKFGPPWSWFQTITQTRSQFIGQSIIVFMIVLVFAVFFAANGQAVCGAAYVLFFVFVWGLHWAIGRSGVDSGY